MDLQKLAKVTASTVHSAGPRYTPGIDSAAPNLQIEHLNLAMDGLLCSDRFKKTITEFHDSSKKGWADAGRAHSQTVSTKNPASDSFATIFLSNLGILPGEKVVPW